MRQAEAKGGVPATYLCPPFYRGSFLDVPATPSPAPCR